MKNDQVVAARRALNPHRSTIKLDIIRNEDGSETATPYLIASPETRGADVVIRTETSVAEVGRSLAASIGSLL